MASRVVHQGAGLRLSAKDSAEKIRKAVLTVLREERFRHAAARLASIIDEERRSIDVVKELEALLPQSAPHDRAALEAAALPHRA